MSQGKKIGPSIGEVLMAGVKDLQNMTVAFPTAPSGPDYGR